MWQPGFSPGCHANLTNRLGAVMKLRFLLIIGIAFGIFGCAEKEQAVPESEMESAQPETAEVAEAAEAPVAEEESSDAPDTTYAQVEDWRTAELLDHMHAHAEQLDDLNFALDDGNLERAMTSAYWLSRHDTVKGLPDELQVYVAGMREAAQAVEAAEDIPTARAAAQQIGVACQGCHTAADVVIE